ncbi:MAG: ATP-binding protein [Anaerolineales bacterium]|nr:MAG: ATP-binding protein [Anaerolineales bacterium]
MMMSEPKISEIIRYTSGYSAQVDLNLWYRNNVQNLATVRRYRPIKAHRVAFERVARATNVKDKRCYLLTGNYGTGKSHLCLMLANYFAYPSDFAPIKEFLDNYASVDPVKAEELRSRRAKGRYLIALCPTDATDDFAEVVLRAVLEALDEEGLADELETPYHQALAKLESLEQETKAGTAIVPYYELFEKQLKSKYPRLTMGALKTRLAGLDREALQIFRALHEEILRTPFVFKGANLSAILETTLASKEFGKNFEGIVVFWDEFGEALKVPGRIDVNVFRQFAQLCAHEDPNRARLIFIGTTHRSFASYSREWDPKEFAKVSDRIEPVNLTPEGVEDVIAAIVSPRKDHPLWKEKVLPRAGIFDTFLTACEQNDIFDWLPAPVKRERIIENIYPMHPMATYSVIELSQRVASNNRTVFTFFASESEEGFEEGSYLWHIHNTPIEGESGLNFYTVDLLTIYFADRLHSTNVDLSPTSKEVLRNYEGALRELKRAAQDSLFPADELTHRLLQTMLVYDLIGINISLDNLLFGLHIPSGQKQMVRHRLQELADKQVIYYDKLNDLYEFRRSDLVDLDGLIEDYKREEADKLAHLAVELEAAVPLAKKDQYLEAKRYNNAYGEDKQLVRRFVLPQDLQAPRYFEDLERTIEDEIARDGDFEGVALYVLCETLEDIAKAKDLVTRNPSQRIVVAIPQEPISIRQAILNYKAVQHIKGSPQARDFTPQDNANLHDRETMYTNELLRLRNQMLDNRQVDWHGQHGVALAIEPTKQDQPASQAMESIYLKHSRFRHDDFNKTHNVRNFTKAHLSIAEAVNALLQHTRDLVINTNQAANRGEIRYLERCLYQQGILRQVKKVGDDIYCKVERDLGKFEPHIPALADMIREVQGVGVDERINLRQFIARYKHPPYGLGRIGLSILFATLLRYFGDTIKIKKDEAAVADLHVSDFEMVADIVQGNYPYAFIKYRDIRPGERKLINGVYTVFAPTAGAVQKDVTAAAAHQALKDWYAQQPGVCKVLSFYSDPIHETARRFLETMQFIYARDPHAFILQELQTAFGYEPDELVTETRAEEIIEGLRSCREQVEGTLSRVQQTISQGIKDLFGVTQNTWDDIADGVKAWYNSLDSNQRDASAPWHTHESKPLIVMLADPSQVRDIFMERLPETQGYDVGKVAGWGTDKIQEYLKKIREGKAVVEANKIKVPSPQPPVLKGHYEEKRPGVYSYRGPLTLTIEHEDPNVTVLITDNGQSPLVPGPEIGEFIGKKTIRIHELAATRPNPTIKYVARDAEGNYGIEHTLRFIDETIKYAISVPQPKLIKEADIPINTFFPPDGEALRTFCRTLFEAVRSHNVVSAEELQEIVTDALNKVLKE